MLSQVSGVVMDEYLRLEEQHMMGDPDEDVRVSGILRMCSLLSQLLNDSMFKPNAENDTSDAAKQLQALQVSAQGQCPKRV